MSKRVAQNIPEHCTSISYCQGQHQVAVLYRFLSLSLLQVSSLSLYRWSVRSSFCVFPIFLCEYVCAALDTVLVIWSSGSCWLVDCPGRTKFKAEDGCPLWAPHLPQWASDAFCLIVKCNTHPVLFLSMVPALSSCLVSRLCVWVTWESWECSPGASRLRQQKPPDSKQDYPETHLTGYLSPQGDHVHMFEWRCVSAARQVIAGLEPIILWLKLVQYKHGFVSE